MTDLRIRPAGDHLADDFLLSRELQTLTALDEEIELLTEWRNLVAGRLKHLRKRRKTLLARTRARKHRRTSLKEQKQCQE